MKICASYKIPVYMWEDLDEIRFSVPTLARAISFIDKHPDTKVIIEVLNLHDDNSLSKEQIYGLAQEYPNMYFDFYSIDDLLEVCDGSRKWMYHYPANTYNMFYFLSHIPVSDITIGEPLVFDLITLKQAREQLDNKFNIRVAPAIGRPELFNFIKDWDDGLKHFWVLPQHKELYNEFFDVIDILEPNTVREETLVKLFTKGVYNSEMRYYLRNGESSILAEYIDDDFVQRRLNCRQVCMQGERSYKCHFCQAQAELFAKLREVHGDVNALDS